MGYRHFRCSIGRYVYFKHFRSYVNSLNNDWRWLQSQPKESFEPINQFESVKFKIPSHHPYWSWVATNDLYDLIQSKKGEVRRMEKRIKNKNNNWEYAIAYIERERKTLYEFIQEYRKQIKYE